MKLLTTGIFTLVLIIIGFLFIVLIPINLGYSNEPDIRLGEYEEIDTNNDLKYEGIELTFLNYGISSETVINVEIKSANFHYTMVNDIFFPYNDKLTIGAGKIARISFTSIDQVFIENDFLEIKIYLSFTGLENSYIHVIEPNFSPNDTFFENIIYNKNKSDTDSGNFLLTDLPLIYLVIIPPIPIIYYFFQKIDIL